MLFALVATLLGLLVGSFLNVVIHRVPRGESIVTPRSHCPVCHTELAPSDNMPVLSWLMLRGRCRHCSAQISGRYPLIELGTGLLFAAAAVRFGPSIEGAGFAVLFASLIAISAIDIELRLVPKRIVWPAFGIGVVTLAGATAATGEPRRLAEALGGAAAAFAVLFAIHVASPRGMGFGDVRMAALLGLFLGWLGPAHVALGLFAGFVSGGIGGLIAVGMGRSRKSALPFAPFLAAGTAFAVLAGRPILDWYLGFG